MLSKSVEALAFPFSSAALVEEFRNRVSMHEPGADNDDVVAANFSSIASILYWKL